MKYNPALDGVRAVAVIVVVAFHGMRSFFNGGMIGVDVFFVLSGFLITTLLRSELHGTGHINLKRFYLRRAVRLMPPLVLAMSGTYAAYAILFPRIDIKADILAALFYVSDYGKAFWGVPSIITHTWSLSVEEHFYLIWPVVLIATRSLDDRSLFRLLIVLFVAATAWRFADALIWADWTRTYYRFDTRTSGIFLGAALAVRQWRIDEEMAGRFSKYALYGLAFLVLGLHWRHMPSLLFGGLAAEIMTALLIVSLTSGHETSASRALAHPSLVYIGVLSYSIYLWHYGITIALKGTLDPLSVIVLTFASAVGISALSHKMVEMPLRRWCANTGLFETQRGNRLVQPS